MSVFPNVFVMLARPETKSIIRTHVDVPSWMTHKIACRWLESENPGWRTKAVLSFDLMKEKF